MRKGISEIRGINFKLDRNRKISLELKRKKLLCFHEVKNTECSFS